MLLEKMSMPNMTAQMSLALPARGIHYARLEHSPRLQRVLALLRDGQPHSTMDIIARARVVAVNSAITELRRNGIPIDCRSAGRGQDDSAIYEYKLVEGGRDGL